MVYTFYAQDDANDIKFRLTLAGSGCVVCDQRTNLIKLAYEC